MDTGVYVALSAQMALQKRLDTIAGNVANAGTVGFRAEEVTFETFMSKAGEDPVAFASSGETFISRKAGELVRTENPLDVAVKGDAWLAIQSPQGNTVYTRDGRLRMLETGELQTLNGEPVLDVGGAAILIDPAAGPPRIAADGMITQGGRQIGAIGLFSIPENAVLTRAGTSGVIPDRPAEPVLDFTSVGVVQGFIERGNVNPVMEMSNLIQVTRAFESISAMLGQADDTITNGIKTLGTGS
jgi:flagellar basal-body rod protein FlgF